MRFLIKDGDGNAAAIIYAVDEPTAIDLWWGTFAEQGAYSECEDISDVPTFGIVGIDDREVCG